MKPTIENKPFFTILCQIYQNFEKPPQRLQNSEVRSQFLQQKLKDFFSVKIFRPTFISENFRKLSKILSLFSKNVPNFCQLCS